MRVFLCEQSGREDRIALGTVLACAFVILENPKIVCEIQELIMSEAEFLPPRMLVAKMIVDEKGFVDEHPAGPERANQRGKERAVEVKKSENDIVAGGRDRRRLRRIFKLHGVDRERCQAVLRRGCRQTCQSLLITINRLDRKTLSRQVERVSATPTGDIQGMSMWQPGQGVFQELRGG
jgi:hypothetical protein